MLESTQRVQTTADADHGITLISLHC